MDVSVIVRNISERTLPLCLYSLMQNDFDINRVHLVNNEGMGFGIALRNSFELAAALPSQYVLILDADVVLAENAKDSIAEHIAMYPDYYRIEFRRRCKFTSKGHGIHLYNREKLVRFGLTLLDTDVKILKPESDIVRKMYLLGLNKIQVIGDLIGWHDYEQYNKHISLKMYNRAMREPYMLEVLHEKMLKNPNDSDFEAAIYAFNAGLKEKKKELVYRDINFSCFEKKPIDNVEDIYEKYRYVNEFDNACEALQSEAIHFTPVVVSV